MEQTLGAYRPQLFRDPQFRKSKTMRIDKIESKNPTTSPEIQITLTLQPCQDAHYNELTEAAKQELIERVTKAIKVIRKK